MASLNRTQQFLLDCLKRTPDCPAAVAVASLGPADWESLLDLARIQRVGPLLYHRLRTKRLDAAIPEDVRTSLQRAYRENTLRNLLLYGEFQRLAAALDREGIPFLLLKGIVMAGVVYGDIGLREMNDIDLLARPEHLSRIAGQLEVLGYAPRTRIYIDATLKAQHHLPRFLKAHKAGFEIHWNLTTPGRRESIDPAGLWKRAAPVRLNGQTHMTLCPADMLLHLCHHTSYGHEFAFGLRPSCDIAEFLAHCGGALDWAAVQEQAKHRGWQRGVYLALRLARELVGADIPAYVIKELCPADMDEDIVTVAKSQVFTDARIAATVPIAMARLITSSSLLEKGKILWQRVFLPLNEMAVMYPPAHDSWLIYCYYPVRAIDMLRRHAPSLRQIHNPGMTELMTRKIVLDRWLMNT